MKSRTQSGLQGIDLLSIRKAVPHIFRRPFLSVRPEDSILYAGTFLAIGPQIYVDALIVLDNNEKAVGVIGSKHIIGHLIGPGESKRLQGNVSDVMDTKVQTLEADLPLQKAIRAFYSTKFAFASITIEEKVAASLSMRDLLPVVAESNIQTTLGNFSSSHVVTVSRDTSIGAALELMLQKNLRNLVAKGRHGEFLVLNDRMMLEFLFSYEGRKMISNGDPRSIYGIGISSLGLIKGKEVNPSTTLSEVAKLMMMDISTPCVFLQDSIITPWDIVMGAFAPE